MPLPLPSAGRRFRSLLLALLLVAAACSSSDSSTDAVETPSDAVTTTDAPSVTIDQSLAPDPEIDCLGLDEERCAVINSINCAGFTEEICIEYREEERDYQISYDPTEFAFGQIVEVNDDGLNPRKIDGLVDEPIGWANNTSEPIVIEFLNGEPVEGLADTGEIAPGDDFTFEIGYARSIWYRVQGTEIEGIFEVDNPQGPDVILTDE